MNRTLGLLRRIAPMPTSGLGSSAGRASGSSRSSRYSHRQRQPAASGQYCFAIAGSYLSAGFIVTVGQTGSRKTTWHDSLKKLVDRERYWPPSARRCAVSGRLSCWRLALVAHAVGSLTAMESRTGPFHRHDAAVSPDWPSASSIWCRRSARPARRALIRAHASGSA